MRKKWCAIARRSLKCFLSFLGESLFFTNNFKSRQNIKCGSLRKRKIVCRMCSNFSELPLQRSYWNRNNPVAKKLPENGRIIIWVIWYEYIIWVIWAHIIHIAPVWPMQMDFNLLKGSKYVSEDKVRMFSTCKKSMLYAETSAQPFVFNKLILLNKGKNLDGTISYGS